MDEKHEVEQALIALEAGAHAQVMPGILREMRADRAEDRSWVERLLLKFMGKGVAPEDAGPDAAPEDEGADDTQSGRGAGLAFKGYMCKGPDCGHAVYMRKAHPHFGKKRQVAEELARGMHCPRCGQGVSPLMSKGDDAEMDDMGTMDKGLAVGPEIDQVFQRLNVSTEALVASSQALPGMAEAILATQEMAKGLAERMDALAERMDALNGDMAKGVEFQGSMAGAFERFAEGQAALHGLAQAQAELIKGLEPRTPTREVADRSLFDLALDNARQARLPQREMDKGSDTLTDAELDLGVALGKITRADKVAYRSGMPLSNGIGRDTAFFRKLIG